MEQSLESNKPVFFLFRRHEGFVMANKFCLKYIIIYCFGDENNEK